MRCISFLLALILGYHYVQARVNSADTDTTQVYQLIETAGKKVENHQMDSAELYYKKAGQLAKSLKFDKGYLEYAGHYTGFLYKSLRYREALDVAREQLAISIRIDNKQKAANAHNNMALQYQAMGNMQEAAKHLLKALELSAFQHDLVNQQKYNTNLGSLFIDMKDYKKALLYTRKGNDIAKELNDSLKIGYSMVNLLIAETMNGMLGEALKHTHEVLAVGKQYSNIDLMMSAYNNMGELYLKLSDYQKALRTFQEATKFLEQAPPEYNIYIYQGLASVYKQLEQYQQADKFYTKSIGLAESQLPKPELKTVFQIGSEIKEAIGDLKGALLLRKKIEALNDSLLNEDIHRTIHELEIKHQTSQKEKALAKQELKLSQQQIELDRKNKWIALAAFAVLLLIAILIFMQTISKQKRKIAASIQKNYLLKARLKGEEEERARTARELHDGVASILSAAKLHFNLIVDGRPDTEKINYKQILYLMDSAVQEIRNISHNLAPEVVLTEGFEYAIREFCSRMSNSQLQFECYILGTFPTIPKSIELLLYRIIQEAITNTVKHAQASEGIVQILAKEKRVSITIEDNGRGFHPQESRTSGIGLRNMSSRIQLLNGSYEIQSIIGKGTSIYIEIDVQATGYFDKTPILENVYI